MEAHEWVEIKSLESIPISLHGWMIEDAQALAPLPDYLLRPQETVLIVGSAARMHVPPGRTLIVLDRPTIGSGLRNQGDRVALVTPYGVRYDAVSWGDVRSPRYMEPPGPRESIIRSASGNQRVTEELTPWTVSEWISAEPQRHRHPRPDTQMRITSAMIDPIDGRPESITIRNISPEPLLTINWTLTVGQSLVKLRSVRIRAGDVYTISDPDGRIGPGLAQSGGHLVLRDQRGNWLATASWGEDETFHRQPAPQPGEELRFNPLTRVHPRAPWHNSLRESQRLHVADKVDEGRLNGGQPITFRMEREPKLTSWTQSSQEDEVWISEVHPNAGQGRNDAAFEWFELTNLSDRPIDLTGWTIADNTSSDSLDGLVVPPTTSVIVGVTSEAQQGLVAAIADGRIGNGLANAGDRLHLVNVEGVVVSAISWGSDRTYDEIGAPDETQSVHRSSPSGRPSIGPPSPGEVRSPVVAVEEPLRSPGLEDAAAQAAAHAPTEAAQAPEPSAASVAATGVMITEILPAPLSGQPEWIELFNPSDDPIDLAGWAIGDLARRTELSGAIPPGGRLVVTSMPLDVDMPALVVDRIGNGLNNDADTIAIYDADGRVVHQVSYGTDELTAPGGGLSIALDPARWVVTAQPSPGSDVVIPLLEDAFRSAAIRAPISEEGRLPVVQAQPQEGINAWMIVSFALIGVILTLSLRRWQPPQQSDKPAPEPAQYSGPTEPPSTELETHDDAGSRRSD